MPRPTAKAPGHGRRCRLVVRAELGTMTESFGLLLKPEVAAIFSTGVAALRCVRVHQVAK
jgi:hypothetical protein